LVVEEEEEGEGRITPALNFIRKRSVIQIRTHISWVSQIGE
jgi:hypothetical protein